MSRWGALFPAATAAASAAAGGAGAVAAGGRISPSAKLLLLSGPSGVGKSELIKRLLAEGFECVRSFTTRAPRAGESEGNPYHFVDEKTFLAMQAEDKFLIGQKMGSSCYGARTEDFTTLIASGKSVVFDMDPRRVAEVKAKIPAAISILLLPESYEILQARMRRRDARVSEADLAGRLEHARTMLAEMMSDKDFFGTDYWIVNPEDKFEDTLSLIKELTSAHGSAKAAEVEEHQPPHFIHAQAELCSSLGMVETKFGPKA